MLKKPILKKTIQVIFFVTFWAGMAFICIQTWRFPTTHSTENRTLSPKPEWPHSVGAIPDYVRQFEAWWSDSMAYRQLFIRHFNLMRMKMGISPQKDIVIGKEGWLFGDHKNINGYRNSVPFSQADLIAWRKYLVYRHLDAKKRGAKFLFVVVPDKEEVYGEYLPSHIVKLGNQSRVDQIMESVRGDGVAVLDLRAVLQEGKKHNRVYHQTDSHWNLIGANYAQHAIAQALAPDFPRLKPELLHPQDDFEFAEGWRLNEAGIIYYGGQAYMLGIADLTNELEPLFKHPKPKCAKPVPVDLGPWAGLDEVTIKRVFHATQCPGGQYRVVIFRDSFTELLEHYMSETYKYILYLWLPRPMDMHAWGFFMDTAKPDIVIDETVAYFLDLIPRSGIDYPADMILEEHR